MAGYGVSVLSWRRLISLVVVFAILITVPLFAAAPDKDMQGVWRGEVTIPDGPTVKVNLQFYKTEEGEDCLFLIVPEDDTVLNVKDLTMKADSLWFDYEDGGLTFSGSLERGKKIEGEITQSEISMPITFVKDTK